MLYDRIHKVYYAIMLCKPVGGSVVVESLFIVYCYSHCLWVLCLIIVLLCSTLCPYYTEGL